MLAAQNEEGEKGRAWRRCIGEPHREVEVIANA
jgi:hypothetical protein